MNSQGKFTLKDWRLVDLNYNFECDWIIELSDNKLCDENLTSELEFFKSITIAEIVIFMIILFISHIQSYDEISNLFIFVARLNKLPVISSVYC